MATIVINKPTKGIAWGGVYWQYFENLENITPAKTPLSIQRQLYKVTLNERGEILSAITNANPLKVGDKVLADYKGDIKDGVIKTIGYQIDGFGNKYYSEEDIQRL